MGAKILTRHIPPRGVLPDNERCEPRDSELQSGAVRVGSPSLSARI